MPKFFVVLLFVILSSYSNAKDYWGAIAVNEKTGVADGVWNFDTEQLARNAALKACAQKSKGKCKVAAWFANQCGAAAWSADNRIAKGGLGETTKAQAERDALLRCQSIGGKNCKIVDSLCTSWDTVEYIWW